MSNQRYDAYIICTSPRSGSTLLCKMLTATACAGVPESYFHTPSVADWLKEYGLRQAGYPNSVAALRAVFAQVSKQGRGATQLFGLRVQRPSFAFLVQHMALLFPEAKTDLARFEAAFGRTRFVHLTRQDKLAQAVSMVRAEQTGLWHRHADGRELERLAPASAPIYDRLAIAQKMALLAGYDRSWLDWFEREQIDPLRIEYEDLAANPEAVLWQVMQELGCDPAAAARVVPQTAKLSDRLSAEWMARFSADIDV